MIGHFQLLLEGSLPIRTARSGLAPAGRVGTASAAVEWNDTRETIPGRAHIMNDRSQAAGHPMRSLSSSMTDN